MTGGAIESLLPPRYAMGMGVRAYLGIGGNLGDVEASFSRAIALLDDPPRVRVLRAARRYRTRPIGPPGQPDFLNSALEIETLFEPLALLDRLKQIETEVGRTAGERWGPRVIDLDLLLYGDQTFDHPRLSVPHRELTRRRFALAPLADLAFDLTVPGTDRTVGQWLAALADDPGSVRLA